MRYIYTQDQLEAMSNFEINAHLCIELGMKPLEKQENTDCAVVMDLRSSSGYCKYDYCGSAGDMWPLLKPNGISLIDIEGDTLACSGCEYGVGEFLWVNDVWHENQLRAAAIVYILIMQEKG